MQFSSAVSMMLSRPSSYAGMILKTPSMRGHVEVAEVTYENSGAGGVFPDAFPAGVDTPARGSARRNAESEAIEVYDGASWVAAERAVALTFFENDQYQDEDDSGYYRFYAAVDAGGRYWWSRGTAQGVEPFVFDPQLMGLVTVAGDWDRVDSSALDSLNSHTRW